MLTSTEKLMLALRDGRKLTGILRSWDQFGMIYSKGFSQMIDQN
jgi:hypothetical protein